LGDFFVQWEYQTRADVDRRDGSADSSFASVEFDSEEAYAPIGDTLTRFGQLGTAFGLAITTIAYNSVLEEDSRSQWHPGQLWHRRIAELGARQNACWELFAHVWYVWVSHLVRMLPSAVVAVPSEFPHWS
jgi:hypothetical protein